jgi:hypothetical protein
MKIQFAENKQEITEVIKGIDIARMEGKVTLGAIARFKAKNTGRVVELVETDKPRARFCWHCARKFQGSHFAEHETGSGTVYVHKDCKKILDGGFDHVRAVDDEGGEDLQSEFIR